MSAGAALRLDDAAPAPARPLWKRRWVQNVGLALLAVLGSYGLIYRDVVSRARDAFQQGEMHMSWYRNPDAKKRFFNDKMVADRASLEKAFASRKIAEPDYRRKLEALEFDRDFALSESSVKYAYQWYKDAYEMFSPPESRWARQARVKAVEALTLWKQELRSQNVPFENSMFE